MADCFYKEGLRFECTRCSACCRFTPGFVLLSLMDVKNLLKATGLSGEEFMEIYCREVNINGIKQISLIEKGNCDCIFWENGGCTVYKQRPVQCRSFPFWSSNLASQEGWNKLKSSCPGMGKGSPHSKRRIEHWLKMLDRAKYPEPEDIMLL